MSFTLLIVRGEKVPLWMLALLQQLGIVQIMTETEIEPEGQDKYTSTVLYVSGSSIPDWMKKLLQLLGTVTINEEDNTAPIKGLVSNANFGGQRPPMYVHTVGLFTPSLFLRAAVRGFTHFDDNRQYYARIELDKIHVYSKATGEYACVHVSLFMQLFQASGKASFSERISQIMIARNIEFVAGPMKVDIRQAISLMKWDQSLMAFFTA